MTSDYQSSYGYQLAKSRNEAGLTQAQLANSINKQIISENPQYQVGIKLIQEWEANNKVPTDEMLQNVSSVIAEKLNLQGQDKTQFFKKMLKAASITREAIAAGLLRDEGKSWFGKELREAMEKAKMTETDLSEAIGKLGPKHDYDFDAIYKVEHGLEKPDQTFIDAAKKVTAKDYVPPKPIADGEYKNVIDYLLKTMGRNWMSTHVRTCGRTTEREIMRINDDDGGFYNRLSVRGHNVLIDEMGPALQKEGVLDDNMNFVDGPYKGRNCINLLHVLIDIEPTPTTSRA